MATDDRSRNRALWAGGGAAAVAGVVHALPAASQPVPALGRLLGVDTQTASRRGVALTFDDGPHPQGTRAVLEILQAYGVRATFFLVGEQVVRSPATAAEVVAAGHTIALHGDRHRNMLRLAPWQVRDDLRRGEERVGAVSGRPLELYRPPYGVFNAAALAHARRRGWRPLLWTQWGRDWAARATPESIASKLLDGVGEGSVLLLHDADDYSAPGSWRRTAAALPRVLDGLAERGFAITDA